MSGSVSAKTLLFQPYHIPWAKIHVPGLQKADEAPRHPKFAQWPYYVESEQLLGLEDDVVAFAVMILESLYSDLNLRDYWNDLVKLEDKYDYQPCKLIEDVIPRFKVLDHPYRPLALVLEAIA